jgi:S-adenosylmethionine decarboxylase
LSIFAFLCSCLAFGAIAVGHDATRLNFFQRILARFGKKPALAAAPVLDRAGGWNLIHSDDEDSFNEWLGHDEEGLPFRFDEELSLGSHLLVELYGCDQATLENEKTVGSVMRQAASQSEATVVAQSFHEFQPYGVSGAVIIQESHYTIHTWPEHGYAAVDLFYCGGTVKVHKAVEVLRESFKPSRIKFLVVRRGLQSEVAKS